MTWPVSATGFSVQTIRSLSIPLRRIPIHPKWNENGMMMRVCLVSSSVHVLTPSLLQDATRGCYLAYHSPSLVTGSADTHWPIPRINAVGAAHPLAPRIGVVVTLCPRNLALSLIPWVARPWLLSRLPSSPASQTSPPAQVAYRTDPVLDTTYLLRYRHQQLTTTSPPFPSTLPTLFLAKHTDRAYIPPLLPIL